MSQEQIATLMNQLNGEGGPAAHLTDWNNWSFEQLNTLLMHSLHCSGCNTFCGVMKVYWELLGCTFEDPLYIYHLDTCTNDECEIPCCVQIRNWHNEGRDFVRFIG